MWSAEEFRRLACAFDTETHKIQPGLLVPPLVCASWSWWDPAAGQIEAALLAGRARYSELGRNTPDALDVFRQLLADRIIVGAHIAFDMAVMARFAAERGHDLLPEIYRAYSDWRVFDIQIAEMEHAIGHGCLGLDPESRNKLRDPVTRKLSRYSLSVVTHLVLDRVDAKDNAEYRMRYASLEAVPIEEWPEEARVYPVDDVCNPLEVAHAQYGLIPRKLYPEFA
jgi:hypothetical protein